MQIQGCVEQMKLRIDGRTISFSPLVNIGNPRYIILAADVIKKYPGLLSKILEAQYTCMRRKYSPDRENVCNSLVIESHKDLFKTEISEMTLCTAGKHIIRTTTESPVCQRGQRVPIHFESLIEEEIKKNLELGIIRHSSSPWCSRIVPVTKKDGSLRLCIDFRALNALNIKDSYPIPRIDEILDSLAQATVFSTLDATSWYYQIAIEESDKHKTAFA